MHRQLSVQYSSVDTRWGDLSPVLEGDLDHLPPPSSRIIRVFLSSTFSDTTSERNALMERVYPALKDFCRQFRLEFQVMDLRWGIRDQSHDDHTIIDFCLREIDNCKRASLGVNFVILIGQKYGYRPFPPRIRADEYETICEGLIFKGVDTSPLDQWFRKNTNVIPPVYLLQPISSMLPDYINKDDAEAQGRANKAWEGVHARLQGLLREGVTWCVERSLLPPSARDKYFISVTEYEIERGLLHCPGASKDCLCFVRTIKHLAHELTRHKRALKYIDVRAGGKQVDEEAQRYLAALQQDKIASVLPPRQVARLEVAWPRDLPPERGPTDDERYLSTFCAEFRTKMQWLIERVVRQSRSVTCNSQVVEIMQHLEMCKTRCASFKGRETVLRQIRTYLEDPGGARPSLGGEQSARPLIIHGESGSGKTSLIAKVMSRARTWLTATRASSKPVVIVRFLGTTSHSCSVRLVLASLCWHVASAYSLDTTQLPGDYSGLVAYFHAAIKSASKSRPLVLLLDGLDQLTPLHRAHGLAWLPKTLPPHVRLVVSTLPQRYELLDTLRMLVPDSQAFVEVLPLGSQLSLGLVKDWLRTAGRDLTSDQLGVVEGALTGCSLPLYASLVYEEVSRWCSYTPALQTVLEATVEGIIHRLFDRVELYHGLVFVSHALSYLTASKNGLSDMELEDLLSLDDEVLNDVFQHWLPPVRRVPPLLVPRLRDELASYVMQREANGTVVFYWYHSQFIEVARRRYLSSRPHRLYIHTCLAHYFLGTWGGGRPKPFTYSKKQVQNLSIKRLEAEADRMVPHQPLIFGDEEGKCKIVYNLRKLSELPHHLLISRMHLDLTKHVLFNYDWLHAKLSATSLHDVLSDFHHATVDPEIGVTGAVAADVQLLGNALRLGGASVNQNPDTLAFDLIGRLLIYYDRSESLAEEEEPPRSANAPDTAGVGVGAGTGAGVQTPKKTLGGHLQAAKSRAVAPQRRIARRLRHDNLHSLLQQCDSRSLKHSALVPIAPCFEAPTMMSLYVLEAHTMFPTDLVFSGSTNELVTVSKDRVLFWDLVAGELSRAIELSGLTVGSGGKMSVYLSADEKLLVVDCDAVGSPVYVFDMKSLNLLRQCGSRHAAQQRVFLVGSLLYRQRSIIDIRTGVELKKIDDFVSSKNFLTCMISPDERLIVVGDQNITMIFDFVSGRLLAGVPELTVSSVLTISDDSRRLYVGHAQDCLVAIVSLERTSPQFGKILLEFKPQAVMSAVDLAKERAFLGNEICGIETSPTDPDLILINVNRFHLIVLNVVTSKWTLMDSDAMDAKMSVVRSMFSGDGRCVLACVGCVVNVWNPDDGHLLGSVRLHSHAGFPICVHRNLVATGSNIHMALHVWDLDGTCECRPLPNIQMSRGPVDQLACVARQRLVFVKNCFALNSFDLTGFKHINSFGIDVVNVATGTSREFLPFDKYGKLLQMEVSLEGNQMALLLNAMRQWYVAVFPVKKDYSGASAEALRFLPHDNCAYFRVCPNWKYLTTCAHSSNSLDQNQQGSTQEFKLWDVDKGAEIVAFRQAMSPVFTMDGSFLLYIDAGGTEQTLIGYTLETMGPVLRLSCAADSLLAVPSQHQLILATSVTSAVQSTVTLWNFKTSTKISTLANVSAQGILDISRDGVLAVDGFLQIYTLSNGELNSAFAGRQEFSIVRLTDDGLYIIWADDVSVRVGRVADGALIAQTSTHHSPTCLDLLDHGYLLLVGRKDGHLLTMKLSIEAESKVTYRPQSVTDRRNFLLDTPMWSKESVARMDPLYRTPASCVGDADLPEVSEGVKSDLTTRANVPHTVIITEDTSLPFDHDTKRRGSNPLTPHIETLLRKSNSPLKRISMNRSHQIEVSLNSDGGEGDIRTLHRPPRLDRRSKSLQDLSNVFLGGYPIGGPHSLQPPRSPQPSRSPLPPRSPQPSRSPQPPLNVCARAEVFVAKAQAAFRGLPMKMKVEKEFSIGRGLEKTGKMMLGALNIVGSDQLIPSWSLSNDTEGEGEEASETQRLAGMSGKSCESDSTA